MSTHGKLDRILRAQASLNQLAANLYTALPEAISSTQKQTSEAFSNKWEVYQHGTQDFERMVVHQKEWYLDLYGFPTERALAEYLSGYDYVLDAGAGMGYKAAWFATLSPKTVVIAADISKSLHAASVYYSELPNLVFVQCDIGNMEFFRNDSFDYVSCDQVIHHTNNPAQTFDELVRIACPGGEISVYVYRKKALPRELVDDYFREASQNMNHNQLMKLSDEVTKLGRFLSKIEGNYDFPRMGTLGIEGGKMSVQRFIYWNFLKCFWDDEQGVKNSKMINYDWYSPSQAYRYTEDEFRSWVTSNNLKELWFHREHACYSGRFRK